LITQLNQKGAVTILVVTHDLHSAFRIATRIAILDQGRIVEEGSPEVIKRSSSPVVRQFLAPGPEDGSPAVPTAFAPLEGLTPMNIGETVNPNFEVSQM
jgi:ABC-type transporter Mla maintaining outer membrane lipid asymmetry ATPase subunit MlaF